MIKRDDDDDPFRLAPLPEKEEEDATRVVVVALEELVHAKQLMIAKNERQDSPFSLSLSLYIYIYISFFLQASPPRGNFHLDGTFRPERDTRGVVGKAILAE